MSPAQSFEFNANASGDYKKIETTNSIIFKGRKWVHKFVRKKVDYRMEKTALEKGATSDHVAKLLDSDDRKSYLVIEAGKEAFELFQEIVGKEGLVPYDIASMFTKDLLTALSEIHSVSCDICHGDIKLENMMYSPSVKRFKLFDFGLSSHPEEFKTRVGSLGYLAPEGFGAPGETLDGRKSDIWSAGICIYAAWCAMRVPWKAANETADRRLSEPNNDESMWLRMITMKKYVFKKCYETCKYLGPSILLDGMLTIPPEDRPAAIELLNHWNVLTFGR
jgi:serine/threonine protein kinase